MSKGHLEALKALRERNAPVTKPKAAVTKPIGGRPRIHQTGAARSKAYRDRKKAAHALEREDLRCQAQSQA